MCYLIKEWPFNTGGGMGSGWDLFLLRGVGEYLSYPEGGEIFIMPHWESYF